MPLDKVIAQALYMQFPRNRDSAATSRREFEYQITYVDQPENSYTLCGIPDGAFRTIVFPIAVRNLRPVRQWIQEIIEESPLTYPISVEVKRVFRALNYLEGKAPDWTPQEAVVFYQSVIETGLAPEGFPVRETANDGSAAWTLHREIYFLFIVVPFAGLTDFLGPMVTDNGPFRAVSDPGLRFELQPIVIPALFDMQAESVALWDRPRTTRSFLQFARPGEAKTVPTVEQVIEAEGNDQGTLAKKDAISSDVLATIEQIFQRVTKGVPRERRNRSEL